MREPSSMALSRQIFPDQPARRCNRPWACKAAGPQASANPASPRAIFLIIAVSFQHTAASETNLRTCSELGHERHFRNASDTSGLPLTPDQSLHCREWLNRARNRPRAVSKDVDPSRYSRPAKRNPSRYRCRSSARTYGSSSSIHFSVR